MISLTCPCCRSRIQAPETALGRKGRCPRCQNSLRVTSASPRWYYRELGEAKGPISSKELVELARAEQIGPETLIRRADDRTWRPACKVRGLFPAPAPQSDRASWPSFALTPSFEAVA